MKFSVVDARGMAVACLTESSDSVWHLSKNCKEVRKVVISGGITLQEIGTTSIEVLR